MSQTEQYLVAGATLECPCGTKTCKLIPSGDSRTIMIGDKLFLSVHATKKRQNIAGFGMCTSKHCKGTPQLCEAKMRLAEKWINPVTVNKVLTVYGGEEAVHKEARLLCLFGRTNIIALTTGQDELTESEKQFYKIMREIFGFDDDVIAIMLKVIHAIDESYPDLSEEDKTWLFTRLMGGFYYGDGGPDNYVDPSGIKEGIRTSLKRTSDQIRWGITSGLNSINLNMILHPSYYPASKYCDYEKKYFVDELNISETDYYKLRFQVRAQHQIISKPNEMSQNNFMNNEGLFYSKWKEDFENYSNNDFEIEWQRLYDKYINDGKPVFNDFAHQEITTASNLNDGIENSTNKLLLGFLSSIFENPIKEPALMFKDLSGWYGDLVLGDNEMTNDDYKADLDAVNIAERIRNNEGNIIEVMIDYYEQDNFNRAYEFLNNRKTIIKNPIEDMEDRIRMWESGEIKPIQEHFLDKLENGNNEFIYEE